jgi:hypothetical protein
LSGRGLSKKQKTSDQRPLAPFGAMALQSIDQEIDQEVDSCKTTRVLKGETIYPLNPKWYLRKYLKQYLHPRRKRSSTLKISQPLRPISMIYYRRCAACCNAIPNAVLSARRKTRPYGAAPQTHQVEKSSTPRLVLFNPEIKCCR